MRAAVERRVAGWRARVTAYLGSVRGIRVEETADGVRASGRGLRARWLTDPRLRDLRDRL